MDLRNGIAVPHLRAWRQYRLYTQSELAHRANVSRGTVIAGEQGRRIQVIKAARLARVLGIDRQHLVFTPPPPRMPEPSSKA